MAKKEHKISSGKKKSLRKAQNERRIAKFAARKEAGKSYQWKPNPYAKDSKEYRKEARRRAEKKNVTAKLPYAVLESIFQKLDNEIAAAEANLAKKKASMKRLTNEG